jgi:glyceraldehyde 3-phosphate dehydrogenase
MAIRVGINGFGRIGRNIMRAALGHDDIDFVAVNDITSAGTLAHLLKYDSVLGNLRAAISADAASISVDGDRFQVLSVKDPAELPWKALGVDVVFESTGKFTRREDAAKHLAAGAKKVIVTAPAKGPDVTLVVGVNEGIYDPARHHIISNASCTTNCLAPVVKVIHEALGIRHGSITTIHDLTNTQSILDTPHKDLRRARASGLSLIPTTTGSATAIAEIFPELRGKLNGHAVRVPLANASLTDCVFEVERATTAQEVNALFAAAAAGPLHGILGYEERPLVSIDYRTDPRSSIVDALSTLVVDGTQVKVYAWYDNEWGYANRTVELARKVGLAG